MRFWASLSSSAHDTDRRRSLSRWWNRPRPFFLTREGAMHTPMPAWPWKTRESVTFFAFHFTHLEPQFPSLSCRVPMISEKAKAMDVISYEMKIASLAFSQVSSPCLSLERGVWLYILQREEKLSPPGVCKGICKGCKGTFSRSTYKSHKKSSFPPSRYSHKCMDAGLALPGYRRGLCVYPWPEE